MKVGKLRLLLVGESELLLGQGDAASAARLRATMERCVEKADLVAAVVAFGVVDVLPDVTAGAAGNAADAGGATEAEDAGALAKTSLTLPELHALTVVQLRAYLENAGVSQSGCLEKVRFLL